ncbi:hypothetical protein KY326_00395 [Candidatus Woesearchaeota archaeon]|nr:hypothetical protein [Candidatus Woesearchaeota archaeon]
MAKKKPALKKEHQKEEEVFFVGIKDPVEIRRDLLESTKDTITIIKTYENIKALRTEKAKYMLVIQKLIKELNILVSKLKRVLPETRVREKPKAAAREDKEEKPPRKLTEFEKLEAELSSIEEKLAHL